MRLRKLIQDNVWISVMGFTLLLAMTAIPLLGYTQYRLRDHLDSIRARSEATRLSMRHLDDDIALAQTLNSDKDRQELEAVLQPVDRLQTASLLERQAELSHLEHFDFALAPEQPIKIDLPSGPQNLSVSKITISADALTDSAIYLYLDQIKKKMQGRLRVMELAIERIDRDDDALTTANTHFTVTLEWLSNGADTVQQTLAVTP